MKFVIVAVVVLALAMSAQSSVIPLGLGLGLGHRLDIAGHGLSYTAVSGPTVVGLPGLAVHAGIPAAIAVAPAHVPAAVHVAPAHVPAVAVHAPHVVAGASYVAQTRGAAHVAPLAGHINSVSSVNVAPAPGTL